VKIDQGGIMATYKIHPGIGIARLGNSDVGFYLAPETPAGLPLECDANGNQRFGPDGIAPVFVSTFRDAQGRVKRQAARFQVFVHDEESPEGRPLKIGDKIEGGGNNGTLAAIHWRVYVANKKACWYEFDTTLGERGYPPGTPRRNAAETQRSRLIIDPGPRTIGGDKRRASFDRSGEGNYATSFPPPLSPNSIDALGEMMLDNDQRLIVLGGHGCSGSENTGPGEPHTEDYANNDGWYDDISDGPVMARLVMYSQEVTRVRYIDVEYPAWVIVGYPRYVPQVLDMVTMDEVLHDLYLQNFATDTALYGRLGSFDDPDRIDFRNEAQLRQWRDSGRLTWNTEFRPLFYRDIWPILYRPDQYRFLCDILAQSNYPHDQEQRGLFDPAKLSVVPGSKEAERIVTQQRAGAVPVAARKLELLNLGRLASRPRTSDVAADAADDPYGPLRLFLFDLLRLAGEENEFKIEDKVSSRVHNLPLMPLLCGDNPLTNTAPSKFLRLTDYMLFILKQWADGHFINEIDEGWLKSPPYTPYLPYPTDLPKTGCGLDRGVMSNVLGGAFCPGGEATWIMRNPAIYWEPYRFRADRSISDFSQTAAQQNTPIGVDADYTFNMQDPLSQDSDFVTGLQPGDITKYSALPWQTDFNECTTEPIDVTYADWNATYPDSENDAELRKGTKVWNTMWWPAHRPLQYFEVRITGSGDPNYTWTNWSGGIPQTPAGDFKMVTEWAKLGFIIRNPFLPRTVYDSAATGGDNIYVSIETRLR
jgi:hypothetical protein